MKLNENIQRIKEILSLIKEDVEYTEPNFDTEWGEAERYIEHPDLDKRIEWTKEEWLEKVKNGKVMRFSEIDNLQNTTDPQEFEELLPDRIERFLSAYSKKVIEMPIAVEYPNGIVDLVAGNTRVTGLRNVGVDPKIWVFKLSDSDTHKVEQNEQQELTERCWKGYTQKGMKTMFGKRYPNCVKIKK